MRFCATILFAFVFGCGLAQATTTTAPAGAATVKQATAFFHATTFGRMSTSRDRMLHKWTGPLKVTSIITDPKATKSLEDDTDAALDTVRRLTGMEMQATKDVNTANFHLVFTREAEFADVLKAFGIAYDRGLKAIARDNACLGLPSVRKSGPPGTYSHGVVLIATNRDPWVRRACLWRTLFQAMGLFAQECRHGPSVYCAGKTAAKKPTPIDRLLMAVLYDKRLRPGMPETEVMALVPGLLQQKWHTFIPVTD
jgi:hypothetical protein